MTLDPVFRSREAVRQIEEDGFLDKMADSLRAQHETIADIRALLPEVIEQQFVDSTAVEDSELEFLQNNFFLVLFHSIFQSLGCSDERLWLYARLNFCIKGIVTAGDNLFDDESKMLLPLATESSGARFASILQLLCFDRLIHRVCDDGVQRGAFDAAKVGSVHRGLLGNLARIGELEGSEEDGVDTILPVEEMVEKVHRVRGGRLFSLAFVAPKILEEGELLKQFAEAERAIQHLGTAFQIVDDLTDFEFDLGRRSHNILVAEAYHGPNARARRAIERLLAGDEPTAKLVEGVFGGAARVVLDRARREGREAFEQLARLGFWFPPDRSDTLVHAIVGIEGVERMERLASDS